MPTEQVWNMDQKTARVYRRIDEQLRTGQITEAEFTDAIMTLPGCPFTKRPAPGTKVRIIVHKPRPQDSHKRGIH